MATKAPIANPGFFKSIPASIYSPSFYVDVPKRSFWKGFWYFVGVTAFLVLAGVLLYVVLPYQLYKTQINDYVNKYAHFYPEELEITIQDGLVSTNVEEPYVVSFEQFFEDWDWAKENPDAFDGVHNLIVIDTKTPYSVAQFYSYETVAWLTQDALYVKGDNGNIEATPLNEVEDTVINKEMVDQAMDQMVAGIKSFIPPLLLLLAVVALIFLVIFRMIYMVLLSLFTMICFRIMNLPYNFDDAYKMNFYVITLPALVSLLMPLLNYTTGFGGIPYLFTILSLIVMSVNLEKARRMGLTPKVKEA